MKVYVLPHTEAEDFVPEQKTLAIRIFDTFPDNDGSAPLKQSPNWVDILQFTFDDIELDRYSEEYLKQKLPEWEKKFKLFNKDIASRIVKGFAKHAKVPQLLVHCTFGWKRSPAVARALEKLFNLNIIWGNDRTRRIMTSSPRKVPWQGNSHVFKLLSNFK